MSYEELLEYLDLEDGSQFEYFESIADLAECEEYVEDEAVFRLFSEADKTVVEELINDYFEDILDGLPDDAGEIFSLLNRIQLSLVGMISNADDDIDMRRFSDEFNKFAGWYSRGSEVELIPEDGGESMYHTLRDAITASRLEKLGGEKYRYVFENALDYEPEGYTVSMSDLMRAEDDNEGSIVFSPGEEEEYVE